MISSRLVKQEIISLLKDQGYGSFARRFAAMPFVLTDAVEVAAINPITQEIMLNPNMLNVKGIYDDEDRMWEQISVLMRHELLHFLMQHEIRFRDHLRETDPEFEKSYRMYSIHDCANRAMDYDISKYGYDEHDKQIVRTMTQNSRVIGGLILEDEGIAHPDWLDKDMEELYELIKKQLDEKKQQMQQNATLTIKQDLSKSQEYVDMYNKIIATYNDSTAFPDAMLNQIIQNLSDPNNDDPFNV